MVRQHIVDATEQGYFIAANDLNDFPYPVVELPADINGLSQTHRFIGLPDKQ
jgi:hypothetical protein